MFDSALQRDLDLVAGIDAVPRILEVACRTTGLGFAAVARVTDTRWICCSVRDGIGFGLQPGGELQLETTLCDQICRSGRRIVIDDVAHDAAWRDHPVPAMYGFQSYISVPIVRGDGSIFGTLCAIDPRPARLDTPAVVGMFELFAQLIACHVDTADRLHASETALLDARQTAQLREQFIAVLGHDLRNPLQTLSVGTTVLARTPERTSDILPLMHKSVQRMAELIDNLMDLARGRLGGGLALADVREEDLGPELEHVVHELAAAWSGRTIEYQAQLAAPVACDRRRVAQLLSNLLGNALRHGDTVTPIRVCARSDALQFELSVANGGRPIAPAVRQRLFEPYFRGPGSATRSEGLGLGLYIVSEIARAHGGSVEVASDETATCFTFRMPQRATAP
jgi:signal transduction histidine kinase